MSFVSKVFKFLWRCLLVYIVMTVVIAFIVGYVSAMPRRQPEHHQTYPEMRFAAADLGKNMGS